MRKVVLESITMRNFRGEKDRTTEFNYVETTIKGENGIGKSRHFDAFIWLLFGKDSQDRKDYNVKTIIDGKPLERVDTEVSGVINVDGEVIRLRRAYVEKWRKPRGQTEEVFDGHEHELHWNDVPLKVGEYNARISNIIDDSVFKMITNPMFFANMKWQDQRDVLFQLAGTITDQEVAAGNEDYIALLDKISGKSMADFKREIAARKRKLKDELNKIQPRIDQTHHLMPESSDFDALEKEVANLDKQLENIDKSITDKTTAIRQQYEGVQAKHRKVNDMKSKLQSILNDAKMKAKESAFKANSERRELESEIKALESEISIEERTVKSLTSEVEKLESELKSKEEKTTELRNKWYEENAKEYTGDDSCNSCGQNLPESQIKDAKQAFADNKEQKLAQITQKGQELGAEAEQLKQDIIDVEKVRDNTCNSLEGKKTNLNTLQAKLNGLEVVEESEVNAGDLPEYVSLEKQIKELEETINENEETIDTTDLQNQKKAITEKRDAAKNELNNRDLIKKHTLEIENLKEKGKDLSQQIADVEREEHIMQSFTKARIDECEKRINRMFKMTTFKLFDYTIDGNEIETCIPLVNGVPFGTANTAGQINSGIDIINTLVRFHNVSAPIFIDRRESVNSLINTDSQIINLVVSKDKKLIVLG